MLQRPLAEKRAPRANWLPPPACRSVLGDRRSGCSRRRRRLALSLIPAIIYYMRCRSPLWRKQTAAGAGCCNGGASRTCPAHRRRGGESSRHQNPPFQEKLLYEGPRQGVLRRKSSKIRRYWHVIHGVMRGDAAAAALSFQVNAEGCNEFSQTPADARSMFRQAKQAKNGIQHAVYNR